MTIHDIGQITANCGVCGSLEFIGGELADDASELRCAKCSALQGTVGGFMAAAEATAKSAMPDIANAIRKALNFK